MPYGDRRRQSKLEIWDKHLKALKKFKEEHGHVSLNQRDDGALGRWLSRDKVWVRHGTDKKKDKNDTDVIELGRKLRKLGAEIRMPSS